jgi:ketosteroid isomerase-like protein
MNAGDSEVVLRVFDAINRGDIEAAIAETTEDVVVDFSRSISPYHGLYEGREEVRRFWTNWLGSWERLSWEAEAVTEVSPGRIVLVNHIVGRGRGSGIEVEARGGHLWELEDGKVRRMSLFQSLEDARRAASD